MSVKKPPPAPRGLGSRGSRLWRAVTGTYELRPDERELLEEACRTADRLVELRKAGDDRELRLQRELLRKLLASLALPDAQDEDEGRPPSRSASARELALARWGRRGA